VSDLIGDMRRNDGHTFAVAHDHVAGPDRGIAQAIGMLMSSAWWIVRFVGADGR